MKSEIGNKSQYYITPWQHLLDRLDGRIEAFGDIGLDGIADHDMDAYLAAIEKWQLVD